MKKQLYSILTLIVLTLFGSCITEVDELFDKTASERHNDHMTECKQLLVSATNGWLIEYYPGENQSIGGFNYIAGFNSDGNVTLRAENMMDDEKVTSHYSILSSDGVVLSFDTYNHLLHFYSDPDVGWGTNLGGDFEFIYVNGDNAEMIFKGTKTDNIIRFTALPEGVDWNGYMNKVEEFKKKLNIVPQVYFTWEEASGRIELEIDDDDNKFSYIPDSSKPYEDVSVPFCFSPTGIRLYEPLELGEVKAQTFDWDEEAGRFVALDAKNSSGTAVAVELKGTTTAEYVPIEKYLGDWVLSYDKNKQSKAVRIVEKDKYESLFEMTGLMYNIEMKYYKRTGRLAMNVQHLGNIPGYYIYLCVWDIDDESYTWNTKAGFYLTHNMDDANPKVVISDNNMWTNNKATGMLFHAFKKPRPADPSHDMAVFPLLSHLHK